MILEDYKIFKKTDIEKARDAITQNTVKSIYEILGLNKSYHMGQISVLEGLLNCLKSDSDAIVRSDLISVLESCKKETDMDTDVINYIDALINNKN